MDEYQEVSVNNPMDFKDYVDPSRPETIPLFVDPMPIPQLAKPVCGCEDSKDDGMYQPMFKQVYPCEDLNESRQYYHIVMKQAKHRFHRYFTKPTTVWGYNGTYPGPTIEAPKDVTVKVKWENDLPGEHLFQVDHTLHGTIDTPDVRTVVHLHGSNVAADSDGHPEAWFTNNFERTGAHFTRKTYEYTNHQTGCTLWYHDHAIGITRLNVYAGLAGFYLIRDSLEERLNLPRGCYEIPIMIQDKSFDERGELFYPDTAVPCDPEADPPPVPSASSFFFGNTIVVNGKIWPYLAVEPRKYRFRILNASNVRPYILSFENGCPFHQIGTELGLLHEPVTLTSFTLEPAERIDVIVDFSQYAGQQFILKNSGGPPGLHMDDIMQFRVCKKLKCPDTSCIPEHLMPRHRCSCKGMEHSDNNDAQAAPMHCHDIDPCLAVKQRTMHLDHPEDMCDCYNRVLHLLNYKRWDDPVTETPQLDTIEIWHLVNHFDFPHPIHVHLVHFEILQRKIFAPEDFDEWGNYTGFCCDSIDDASVQAYEKGPKDVASALPGMVTSIVMHFKEHCGEYVWHCHILEHEDNDMMRPLRVEDCQCRCTE